MGAAALLAVAACQATGAPGSGSGSPQSSAPVQAGCPTLEDYAAASLAPSVEPAAPSFEPVPDDAPESTGMLAVGETGILASSTGEPGMLVRVTNARFCDRLPDFRPDQAGVGDRLLLADVELAGLRSGTVEGFLPGSTVVAASYAGQPGLASGLVTQLWGMPGANLSTKLDPGPGWTYRGTMAWPIPDGDGQVAVVVVRPSSAGGYQHDVVFSFLVRDGSVGLAPASPAPTIDPAATPSMGTATLGTPVVLETPGGRATVVVDGVQQVARYTGIVPTSGDALLEARLAFGPVAGDVVFDPAAWVLTGPDGAVLPQLHLADANVPRGWPSFATTAEPRPIPAGFRYWPEFVIGEVPDRGRISLEYRPDGTTAAVTWVLRD